MKLPKINGRQVNLLIAKFIEAEIRGDKAQLEYIEYKCGYEVANLEDVETWQLPQILEQLKKE